MRFQSGGSQSGGRGWETMQLVDIVQAVMSPSEAEAAAEGVGLGRTERMQGDHCSHCSQAGGG